jgi:hypothetical protein
MHRSTDGSSPDGRIARPVMAGDEQHDALAAADGLLKTAVDRSPSRVEAHSMKIENAIGLDHAAA